jgi:hypothetical protein
MIDKDYLSEMAHHVGEGGRLTHENAVELLRFIMMPKVEDIINADENEIIGRMQEEALREMEQANDQ